MANKRSTVRAATTKTLRQYDWERLTDEQLVNVLAPLKAYEVDDVKNFAYMDRHGMVHSSPGPGRKKFNLYE